MASGLLAVPMTSAGPLWCFDRRTPFSDHPELDYRIVANWVMAEHKSQGLFQMELGRWTHECFWLFEVSGKEGCVRWQRFRLQIANSNQPSLHEVFEKTVGEQGPART